VEVASLSPDLDMTYAPSIIAVDRDVRHHRAADGWLIMFYGV
jgi:hypothetical protein